MSETTRSYTFAPEHLPEALQAVAKVNRRAAKHGLPGYTTSHKPVTVPVFAERPGFDGTLRRVHVGDREEVELTVHGRPPQFAGWEFVAVLDNDAEAGVVTRPVPGLDLDLSGFRARPGECDHCRSRRHRTRTFAVRHDDGRTAQVGSTCLEAFTGMPVRSVDNLDTDTLAREMGGFGGGETRPPVLAALAAAVTAGRLFGFVTRAAAMDTGRTATAEQVLDALLPHSKADLELNQLLVRDADTAAWGKARRVRDWATAQGGSDYLDNLAVVAGANTVAARNLALLVSAVPAFDREQQQRADRETRGVSDWQGTVGQRVTITGQATVVRWFTNHFGYRSTTSTLLVLRDTGDNLFKWVASSDLDVDQGDRVTVKATVKAHDTYGDHQVRQTVLTRGTVLNVAAEGEPEPVGA